MIKVSKRGIEVLVGVLMKKSRYGRLLGTQENVKNGSTESGSRKADFSVRVLGAYTGHA